MSQSGLLTEDEIRSYINESFSLKLDREAFLKPQRDTIYDIYGIFLDDFRFNWRRPRPGSRYGPHLKPQMTYWLGFIISKFNCPYSFELTDILFPSRKRTVAFLNVLIYVRALLEDRWAAWQARKKDWEADQKKAEDIGKQLSERRQYLEELKIKIANAPALAELREENEKKREKFEAISQKCEVLGAEAKKVKDTIKEAEEANQRKAEENERLDKEVAETAKILEILNNGRGLEKRIAEKQAQLEGEKARYEKLKAEFQKLEKENVEREKLVAKSEEIKRATSRLADEHLKIFQKIKADRENLEVKLDRAQKNKINSQTEEASLQEKVSFIEDKKRQLMLQYKVKEEHAKAELEKKNNQYKELEHLYETKLEQLKSEIETIKKNNATMAAQLESESQDFENLIGKVEKQTNMLVKKYEETKIKSHDYVMELKSIETQLDKLHGRAKEPDWVTNLLYAQVPANSTSASIQMPADVTYSQAQVNATYTQVPANATYIKEADS